MESPTILLFRMTLLCNLMRRMDGNRNLERLRMSTAEMASFFWKSCVIASQLKICAEDDSNCWRVSGNVPNGLPTCEVGSRQGQASWMFVSNALSFARIHPRKQADACCIDHSQPSGLSCRDQVFARCLTENFRWHRDFQDAGCCCLAFQANLSLMWLSKMNPDSNLSTAIPSQAGCCKRCWTFSRGSTFYPGQLTSICTRTYRLYMPSACWTQCSMGILKFAMLCRLEGWYRSRLALIS